MMIIKLQIELLAGLHAKEEWSCTFEIEEATSLADLHNEIQKAVRFNDDHLFDFFISSKAFGSERISFDENEHSLDTKLTDIFPLPKNRKLFYWFDFGDDWIFRVSKTRHKAKPAIANQSYPLIVSESGNKPEQYPDVDW
ncbi:IS1096 element passenger TnpR family protein [Algibacillus agarilyticus]|uniref:IS1096 element passenger TnpR family protein n=1 Tax=Algibacillus agarilyticus TaxID=2234133 RepID=UPI000DCFD3D6|nr:hypothetical protein [Algibacillus agarilyticus]